METNDRLEPTFSIVTSQKTETVEPFVHITASLGNPETSNLKASPSVSSAVMFRYFVVLTISSITEVTVLFENFGGEFSNEKKLYLQLYT